MNNNIIFHTGEDKSNDTRRRLVQTEPICSAPSHHRSPYWRKSAGSYHWTPEGRKLADFSSGVLVMNLGHNPTRWWKRVNEYLRLGAI